MKSHTVKFRHFIEQWNSDLEISVIAKVFVSNESETSACKLVSIRNDSGDSVEIQDLEHIYKGIERELIEYAFERYRQLIDEMDEENATLFGTAV